MGLRAERRRDTDRRRGNGTSISSDASGSSSGASAADEQAQAFLMNSVAFLREQEVRSSKPIMFPRLGFAMPAFVVIAMGVVALLLF
jgi:hypothetical protein